jgi:hypothetical protein
MNEEIKVEKFDTKFLITDHSMALPERFGIVSAFVNNGNPLSNWQADRGLFRALLETCSPFRVVLISHDGHYAVPAYGFWSPDTKTVARIASRFSRETFFWIKDGHLQIKDTHSLAFDDLGRFDEFFI